MKNIVFILSIFGSATNFLQAQTAKVLIEKYRNFADSVFCSDNDSGIVKNLFVLDSFKCSAQENYSTFNYGHDNIVNDLKMLNYYYKFNFGNIESPDFLIQFKPGQPEIKNPYSVPYLNLKKYTRFISPDKIIEIGRKELYTSGENICIYFDVNKTGPNERFEINDDFVVEIRKKQSGFYSRYVHCIIINPFTGEVLDRKWKKITYSRVKF